MELLTPGTGLIIWQAIIFIALFFLLSKLAWKPIVASLKEREESIQSALDAAEKAKIEMASLKSDNEKLLKEAREERDKILREAREAANRFHDEAQAAAKKNADRIIEDAKAVIHTEKAAALR
ncbi:MAG: F0F1 ATP synthase subunit B, partial [Cytophagales bacterium]